MDNNKRKQLIEDYKKWPKGLKDVMATSDKCVAHLMRKSHSNDEAQKIVIEILKELQTDIMAKRYNTAIAHLEMILLDKDVTEINIGKILKDYSHE